MSTYGLDGVIQRWSVEKLTVEQAIGQILLLIREMEERLQELEGRVLSAPDPRELVER